MINLETCKFCIWGFKTGYDTFSHIHEGFYRALRAMGRDVSWVDAKSYTGGIDFSNTFFITQNDVVSREAEAMPLREDCFYAVHNNIQEHRDRFEKLDFLAFGVHLDTHYPILEEHEILGDGTVYYPQGKTVDFWWATDLLPWEIEKNKPAEVFRQNSPVVNYIASAWNGAEAEIAEFARACSNDGQRLERYGLGFSSGPVSILEHVRLTQESRVSPTLTSAEQNRIGYVPCRIFKQISYGQFGVTNSKWVNDVFAGELIYNPNPYQLYYDAVEMLPTIPVTALHNQMNYVAQNHTYLNRINALMKSAELILENK